MLLEDNVDDFNLVNRIFKIFISKFYLHNFWFIFFNYFIKAIFEDVKLKFQ